MLLSCARFCSLRDQVGTKSNATPKSAQRTQDGLWASSYTAAAAVDHVGTPAKPGVTVMDALRRLEKRADRATWEEHSSGGLTECRYARQAVLVDAAGLYGSLCGCRPGED
jgi:hypothetical protein